MRPVDLYRYGIKLADSATTEVEQRTAINRLYYGSHHEACCRFFRANPGNQPINRNRRHTDLLDRFNDPLDPLGQQLSSLLRDLMRMREQVDYELGRLRLANRAVSLSELTTRAVSIAQELWVSLERLSPGEAGEDCECRTAYVARG